MNKQTVDEILQQGISGPLETKPEERRKYLGSLRERIIVALTKNQVAESKVYPQVEQLMKEYPEAHLFLNGNMGYEQYSKYIKLASKRKISHTIVTNKEHNTDIGLVLAMDHAIDKEDIYITNTPITIPEVNKSQGWFHKLFKRKK
ncbi:YueI family protein [Neobacillus sp. LXY-1]|uniref:YueI family protein n=1 Tax=Neobacillus sp. LXY-1 TaxID=3379133 RepID=UPI003EE1DC71